MNTENSEAKFLVWLFERHFRYVGQATIANYLELGRWNFGFRNGLVGLWLKNELCCLTMVKVVFKSKDGQTVPSQRYSYAVEGPTVQLPVRFETMISAERYLWSFAN